MKALVSLLQDNNNPIIERQMECPISLSEASLQSCMGAYRLIPLFPGAAELHIS